MSSAPAVELTTPVQFLKGCGSARAELLARLDVRTVRDLLFFFPRDYQDLTDLRSIEQLEEGPLLSVLGTVDEIDLADRGAGRSIVGMLVRAGRSAICAPCGSISPSCATLRPARPCSSPARPSAAAMRWEMVHPQVRRHRR